jgi:hypothetical protein
MIPASKSNHQDDYINSNTGKHYTKDSSFKLTLFHKSRNLKYSKFENKCDDEKDKPIPENNKPPVL